MTTAAPNDGGSNSEPLKDKLKHPFNNLREKFRDTKLYDLKVGLIHKKSVDKLGKLGKLDSTDSRQT